MRRLGGLIGEHGRRALVKRARPTGPVTIDGRSGDGVGQIAARYGEEIVRLRGAMQTALTVLDDGRQSREHNEAKARRILRDALAFEGWRLR